MRETTAGTFANRSPTVLRYSALLRRRSGERPGLGAEQEARTSSGDLPPRTAGPTTLPLVPALPVSVEWLVIAPVQATPGSANPTNAAAMRNWRAKCGMLPSFLGAGPRPRPCARKTWKRSWSFSVDGVKNEDRAAPHARTRAPDAHNERRWCCATYSGPSPGSDPLSLWERARVRVGRRRYCDCETVNRYACVKLAGTSVPAPATGGASSHRATFTQR